MIRRPRIAFFTLLVAFAALLLAPAPARAYQAAVPSQLLMTVRETAGVARVDEVVRSGVPLPRSLGVRDAAA